MPGDRYLQALIKEMRMLHEKLTKTPLETAFVHCLVWEVDPATGRLTGVTIAGLAEWQRVSERTMRRCIRALEDRDIIRCDFGQNRDGWVELVGYDDLLNPSLWLARLKARAKAAKGASPGESGTRAVKDPLKPAPTPDSPAETEKSFYDSQGGAEGAPIDPASNGHGYVADWARSLETWQLQRTVDNQRAKASRGELDDVARARLRTLLDELAARKASA